MGLLSIWVRTLIHPSTINYYLSKGYSIPRHMTRRGWKYNLGETILVKVCDLKNDSTTKVLCKCDGCDDYIDMQYRIYNRYSRDGKYYCNSCACKIFNSGDNHYKWNNTLTEHERINNRATPEYALFTRKVMARDKGTCQCCKSRADDVHHLDGYNWCVEKRYDEQNGIALCKNCHNNFHSIYGKGNNTKEQFEKWIKHSINLLKYENLSPTKKVIIHETQEIFNKMDDVSVYIGVKNLYSFVCRIGETHCVKGYHIFYKDEYDNLTFSEINKIINTKTGHNSPVILLNTMEKFDLLKDASEKYNISRHMITDCCKYKRKYAGKDKNNNKLVWIYESELSKLSENEIYNRLSNVS